MAAPAFFGWLQSTQSGVMSYGHFGPGDPFQKIKAWCAQAEGGLKDFP
jgi:hypothetical protein